MKYYVKNKTLYDSEVPLNNSDFTEITEEEYLKRVKAAKENREQGVQLPGDVDVETVDNEATEIDYINALESLGVQFNG